jgi:hypothetical protein
VALRCPIGFEYFCVHDQSVSEHGHAKRRTGS